jgi:hypothetical protein
MGLVTLLAADPHEPLDRSFPGLVSLAWTSLLVRTCQMPVISFRQRSFRYLIMDFMT